MNLDQIAIKTRIRTPSQAIDLGLALARKWWWPLYLSWAIPPTLLFTLLSAVLWDHPFIAVFIIWWLKPFWDRLPLIYASRALFADAPKLSELLKQTWRFYKVDCIPWLLWRRLSIRRSFILPVTMLEGLKGQQRSRRITVLSGDHSSAHSGLTTVFFHIEQLLPFAAITFLVLLIPNWQQLDYEGFLDTYERSKSLQLTACWLFFLAMTLIGPFYVVGGFMAYINRRIALEGWDIEIRFRSLAQRLKPSLQSAVIIFACLFAALQPAPSQADQNSNYPPLEYSSEQTAAREEILELLEGEEFTNKKTTKQLQFKRSESDEDETSWLEELLRKLFESSDESKASGSFNFDLGIASLLKAILIALAIGLVIYFILYFARQAGYIKFQLRAPKEKESPDVVFGMQVSPESLPDDVRAQALEWLSQGKIREALYLIYRASLSRLVNHYDLPLHRTQTELECSRSVKKHLGNNPQSKYFTSLTHCWLKLAYAHREPSLEQARELCENWNTVFANNKVKAA